MQVRTRDLSAGRRLLTCLLSSCVSSLFGLAFAAAQTPEPVEPIVAPASGEAARQLNDFRLPDGWCGDVWAAEPMVANPVAFAIDDRGQVYVCESFRQEQGVTDNRSHDSIWLDHDLAARTVEDRIAYHRKLLPNGGADYQRQDDRVRRLADRDGNGSADDAVVFASHLNDLESGSIAGVLPVGPAVWVTCIPHLWRFTDRDGDGRSDERISLQSGFGVRVAFRGHDLHGLIEGLDGRIYFSLGDRGYHLVTAEGKTLSDPESGAVFRCEPDGSRLEVFATGLRNPQELAFDEFGNLFTGDNNSDSGDRARWVYLLPGSDSGWRMAYQYLPDRGPFNREKIWHPACFEQPAFIVPPVANLGDGPSGLVYYPGTGIDAGLDRHFLMCDFRGTPVMSGVRAIRVNPQGAFFEVAENRELIWQILATDLAVGPDGWLYVSDWVNGWVGENKGRIYRFGRQQATDDELVQSVRTRLSAGVRDLGNVDLVRELGHADQRIRLAAQRELVRRQAIEEFQRVARFAGPCLPRIHALWGLSQLARQGDRKEILSPVPDLLEDEDPEVRAQAARLLGEHRFEAAVDRLATCMRDRTQPRVQMMAALAFASLTHPHPEDFFEELSANADRDPALRHGLIMGLANQVLDSGVGEWLDRLDDHAARAWAVALRRQANPEVALLLDWPQAVVAEEAARAIYDLPIEEGLAALAASMDRHPDSWSFSVRALNAAFRLGGIDRARQLAAVAGSSEFSDELREQALMMLAEWAAPGPRDRVLGRWQPVDARPATDAVQALSESFLGLVTTGPAGIRQAAMRAAGRLELRDQAETMRRVADDSQANSGLRAAAIEALGHLGLAGITDNLIAWSVDSEAVVRTAALASLARLAPDRAAEALTRATAAEDLRERQLAWQLLGQSSQPLATRTVEAAWENFENGQFPADTRLDYLLAARAQTARSESIRTFLESFDRSHAADPLAEYKETLVGGNSQRGETIFKEWTSVSCLRCHRVGDQGGYVGPNLSAIGKQKDRTYLLESIVDPNRTIAEKFETVVVLDIHGQVYSGIVNFEDDRSLRLLAASGDMLTIDKTTLEERRAGKSAMPVDLIRHLSALDVRDLVAYLAEQQAEPQANEVESLERQDRDGGGVRKEY